MHNEAADLYELGEARADGAPAPCPANPDPNDNKRRFILSYCLIKGADLLNKSDQILPVLISLTFLKYLKVNCQKLPRNS